MPDVTGAGIMMSFVLFFICKPPKTELKGLYFVISNIIGTWNKETAQKLKMSLSTL